MLQFAKILLGKSVAQDYLLARSLADGLTTAFQSHWLGRKGYLRFDYNGVTFVKTDSYGQHDLHDLSIWALIDDDPIDEFWWHGVCKWVCIWSAPPQKHSYSKWQKEAEAEIRYLGPWTLKELVATRYFCPSSKLCAYSA